MLTRIVLLRHMWHQLCSKPHITGVRIGYDTSTNQLLVLDKSGAGQGEVREEELVVEEEDEDLIEVDLDNSLSLDFSDDDIEYLSDEEEIGSEEQKVGGALEQEIGGDTSNEIQLLKVLKCEELLCSVSITRSMITDE